MYIFQHQGSKHPAVELRDITVAHLLWADWNPEACRYPMRQSKEEEDTFMPCEEEEEEKKNMPADILCVRSMSLRRLPCAFDMTPK